MMKFSGERNLRLPRYSRSLCLLPLLVPVAAAAQNPGARSDSGVQGNSPADVPGANATAPGVPTAIAAPVARPELAPFNILILALDERVLATSFLPPAPVAPAAPPAAAAPAPPVAVPIPEVIMPPARPGAGPATEAGTGAIAPGGNTAPAAAPGAIVPTPGGAGPVLPAPANPAPGPITPAAWNSPVPGVYWRALAQKKQDKDAELFRPVPLPPSNASVPPRPATPAPAAPAPSFLDMAPAPIAAPGRAQLAAYPLRRALLRAGFGDVLNTGTDSTAMTRVLGEKKLSPRVLEALRLSMLQLGAGKTAPATLKDGILAGARVGQALGYRAVVVFTVGDSVKAADGAGQSAPFSLLLVDAQREVGEPVLFDETGTDENSLQEAAGATGAALLEKSIRNWPATIPVTERVQRSQQHFLAAQTAFGAGDLDTAQDELNQAIALDGSRAESYILLGDVLQKSDAVAAAAAYRRALELNSRDGATWAKIAQAATTSTPPDWPRALDAGRRALGVGFDSVSLRVAMATAQFGRAEIFRRADRLERAEDAEFEARQHLDRALELGPDDPNVVRLLTRQLINQKQFEVAVQTLDRVAPRYPRDAEIQSLYGTALIRTEGREEDAFVVSSRVWKLTGQRSVDTDLYNYKKLSEGFDLRLFNLGKNAAQLTTGVANAAIPREAALLQLTRLQEDMEAAAEGINAVKAPTGIAPEVAAARTFAADLMNQALEKHQAYLETGQDIFRVRALELYRQAVAQLNLARTAK